MKPSTLPEGGPYIPIITKTSAWNRTSMEHVSIYELHTLKSLKIVTHKSFLQCMVTPPLTPRSRVMRVLSYPSIEAASLFSFVSQVSTKTRTSGT